MVNEMQTYLYSEIFYSTQGEGKYTGIPTGWLRFFKCNLQCDGFGQVDPTNPATYFLPYKEIDVSKYNTMEDLPVFSHGCDSSYSWSKKFRHLNYTGTVSDICDRITDSMKTVTNPKGTFTHQSSLTDQHMCFTGGEPLLKSSQQCIVEVITEFVNRNNYPKYITIETNGTQQLTEDFYSAFLSGKFLDRNVELFFSVSPKLFSVSGEVRTKAIKPDVVSQYCKLSIGQLKFVINGSHGSWNEMEEVIKMYRDVGVDYPVYVMPVGATLEGQNNSAGDIAREAFQRGYNVSPRVHVYLWGNTIGV